MATAAPVTSTPPASKPRAVVAAQRRIVLWPLLTPCDRCYAREMLLPMSLGLILLMLVLAGNCVYWAINSIVNQGLNVLPVLRLFALAAPGFAVQGIPAGVILAVCLVLNRAVRDNEFIALRVGGASMARVIMPFLGMALLASGVDFLIVEKVAPRTNDLAEKAMMKLMSASAAPLLESDKYFRVGNYYFYVQRVDDNHVLHDVMLYERGTGNFAAFTPTTFPVVRLAKTARENPRVPNQWIFEKVVQHVYNDNGSQLSEARLDVVKINIGRVLSTYWAEQKQPFSMTSGELSQKINDLSNAAFDRTKLQELRVDYYRRFALPLACFVMALLAAPLALRYARHGSFAGLVLAFLLAFLWQGFDSWFRALGIAGYLAPPAAAWATNAIFAASGCLLLWRER
ncbi:MAG TPA: LptF/LptG family permease [Abditibacteriaceae bacterium]|nr:LptF/LptG family permease [Abditibacteriaceae bacterium]